MTIPTENGLFCVTAAQMAALDRRAIDGFGIPDQVLMENAGRRVADWAMYCLENARDGEILILAGHGNNGGDGLVAARHLAEEGYPVRVVMPPPLNHLKPLTAANLKILRSMGIEPEEIPITPAILPDGVCPPTMVIEALYGTGGRSELSAGVQALFETIREMGIPALAIDHPAGVEVDTGRVTGKSFPAFWTVTLGLPKIGQMINRSACGELVVADIGYPPELFEDPSLTCRVLTAEAVTGWLPPKDAMIHKGKRGHLLVVAGSPGKTGAAYLAAMGAARSGAGLVTLGCPAAVNPILETKTTEVMTLPLPDKDGQLGPESIGRLKEELDRFHALAVGPGLGTEDRTGEFLNELLSFFPRPVVVDADGLNLLARCPGVVRSRKAPTVLTPHPGEAARLLQTKVSEVTDDPVKTAVKLAADFGSVVALKMATTVTASPEGEVWLNPTGNPGMASGGTGDVLTGVIGALLARNVPSFQAAAAGVFFHGLAGDLAARRMGETGLLASDLLNDLGKAFDNPEETFPLRFLR